MNDKCFKCLHRINWFCRAYQYDIPLLNIPNCKRYKENKKIKKLEIIF